MPRFLLLQVGLILVMACGAGDTTDPLAAPTITRHPSSQAVRAGEIANFDVESTGTAPLSYQWKKNGAITGSNSATYTTPATTLADNGARFTVVVTNSKGSATSHEATLTVTDSTAAVSITTHPANRTVTVGQTATFSVVATGAAPLVYQWKKGTINVGSDSPSYITPATTLADNGARFSVVVTSAAGHADSTEAILTVNSSTGGAILVNHTHTNLSQIPSAAITAAKTNLKIAYTHTSHGSQLITGMNALLAANSTYTWNDTGRNGALKIEDYAMGGDVGYYPQWVDNTHAYLGAPNATTGRGTLHPDINVVVWSWCGQAASRTQQEMIDTYLTPMTQLEAEYPGIKFVFMTGHLDGTGTTGNLHLRNEQIRTYCQTYNKVLFDFADIESYDPGGLVNYLPLRCDDGCNYDGDGNNSQESNWATQWLAAHPGHELSTLAASCSDCAHSNTLNCIQKGRATWWLWARLGGWNGN